MHSNILGKISHHSSDPAKKAILHTQLQAQSPDTNTSTESHMV